jgi:hypothetical protein
MVEYPGIEGAMAAVSESSFLIDQTENCSGCWPTDEFSRPPHETLARVPF